MAFKKLSTASQRIDSITKTNIKSLIITKREAEGADTKKQDETREYIKREADTETTEQREENIHVSRDENTMKSNV